MNFCLMCFSLDGWAPARQQSTHAQAESRHLNDRKSIIRVKNGTHGNEMSLLVQLNSFHGNSFHQLRESGLLYFL